MYLKNKEINARLKDGSIGKIVEVDGLLYANLTIVKDYILLYTDDPARINEYSENGYVLYGSPFVQEDRSYQAMVLYIQIAKEIDKNFEVIPPYYYRPQTELDLK